MKLRITLDGNIITQPNKAQIYETEQIHLHPDGQSTQIEKIAENSFNHLVSLFARQQYANSFYLNFFLDSADIPRISGYIISFYPDSAIIKIDDVMSSYILHRLRSHIKHHVKRPSAGGKEICVYIPTECFLLSNYDLRQFLQSLLKEIVTLQQISPDASSYLNISIKSPKASAINEYFSFLSALASKITSLSITKTEGIYQDCEHLVFTQLLAVLLYETPLLDYLSLIDNDLKSEHLEQIARPLALHKNIKDLNLQGNSITRLTFLCEILTRNTSLFCLNLHYNKLNALTLKEFIQLFESSQNTSILNLNIFTQILQPLGPVATYLQAPNNLNNYDPRARQQRDILAFKKPLNTLINLITRNNKIKKSKLTPFLLSLRATNVVLYNLITDIITKADTSANPTTTPLRKKLDTKPCVFSRFALYNKDITLNILSFIAYEDKLEEKKEPANPSKNTFDANLKYLDHRLMLFKSLQPTEQEPEPMSLCV